jgi:hypothetical protein
MKKQVYRKSSVGIVNPVFQNRSENLFFSSSAAGAQERMSTKEEEQTPAVQLQMQAEEQEAEESLQMREEEEESVQMKEDLQLEEEEESVQMKERLQLEEEEESVQMKEDLQLEEEEESVQMKEDLQLEEEEESVQMKEDLQLEEEEESVQMKEDFQLEEEEESVQMKKYQSQENGVKEQRADRIEPILTQEKGRGNPMDTATRQAMEQAFGADFGQVRVHTDPSAQWMNKVMHAKAFAHGNDIFFNENNYQPGTKDGKKLLAHELTHTLQQKGQKAKQVQGHWSKSERYEGFEKQRIRAKIHLQFKGAVWNKSANAGLDTGGLASAAKTQIENSFRGSMTKKIMGITVHYEVSTTASLRVISTLSELQFGNEHLLVVLDKTHPKVKGTYGRAPFYGSIVYLNEKHVPNMISGADANTIPHEVGHTAGLKHLIEKKEEKSALGALIKDLHAQVNPDNVMWRGGGHPSYSGAEADAKLVATNENQLDTIDQNIRNKKLNQLDIFGLVDLYSLEK